MKSEPTGYFTPDQGEVKSRKMGIESSIDSGNHIVLSNISGEHYEHLNLTIRPGENVVIIGDNSVARRELIGDIARSKEMEPGKASMPRDARIVYVSPFITDEIDSQVSLRDFFLSARGLDGVQEKLAMLWEESVDNPSALNEAGRLQDMFENAGGWTADEEIQGFMEGLRIAGSEHDRITLETKLSEMSSGQISKSIIGWALFSRAGIIVMDDPSVHLDVNSKEWLVDYINSSSQATILASSDMDFANRVGNRVVEILDTGQTLNIGLGVEGYLVERERMLQYWIEEAKRLKESIDELEVQIRDFFRPAAKKTDNMAQVLRAQVSKLDRMKDEFNEMPGSRLLGAARQAEKPRVFSEKNRSGSDVLSIKNLDIMYDGGDERESTLVEIPELELYRGDKLAVIGRNGSGKSTLLRVLGHDTEENMYFEGDLKAGPSVESAYYSPYTSLKDIKGSLRIELGTTASDAMGILTYWGFDKTADYDIEAKDLRYKDEEARAQFALIMARKPNLLILDEPTSYLTPKYRQKLVDALKGYEGTLLIVSHDPDFLASVGLNGRVVMPGAKKEIIY